MLRNILDTLVGIMTVTEHLPFSGGSYSVIPQWCWWQWRNHRMRKTEGITKDDKKEKNCLDLSVKGWSTYERRSNFRKAKVNLRMLSPVMQSWLTCVH